VGDRPPRSHSTAKVAVELEQTVTTRTTQRTVTFARPFRLGEGGEQFSAGRYSIETDEELLDGMSFPVYRRTATMMQLIPDPRRPGITEIAVIDPQQLEAALAADIAQAQLTEFGEMRPLIAPERLPDSGAQPQESVANVHLAKAEL
jgi:hypothetical protein